MRRPLAIAGFTLLFTNLLCMVLGISASRILGGISLVLLALLWIVKAKNNSRLLSALGGCCFFCLVGCCTFALAFQIQVQPTMKIQLKSCYDSTAVNSQ